MRVSARVRDPLSFEFSNISHLNVYMDSKLDSFFPKYRAFRKSFVLDSKSTAIITMYFTEILFSIIL